MDGNHATAPAYDLSGNTIAGQSGGSYNHRLTPAETDLSYRVTGTSGIVADGHLDVAISRSFISWPASGPAVASVRVTAFQSSSLANDTMFIHDWFKPSDLAGMAFDNTNASDVSTWVQTVPEPGACLLAAIGLGASVLMHPRCGRRLPAARSTPTRNTSALTSDRKHLEASVSSSPTSPDCCSS